MYQNCSTLFKPFRGMQVVYKINVDTGANDKNGNAFDGSVFLTLMGSSGTSEECVLVADDRSTKPFAVDGSSSFTVTAGDVGPLSQVTVRAVSGGAADVS